MVVPRAVGAAIVAFQFTLIVADIKNKRNLRKFPHAIGVLHEQLGITAVPFEMRDKKESITYYDHGRFSEKPESLV